MNYYKQNPDAIVYVGDYKGLVEFTRTASGKWFYTYKISDVFARANNKRSRKDHFRLGNGHDMFDVGKTFGLLIRRELRKCQASFGDEPEELG